MNKVGSIILFFLLIGKNLFAQTIPNMVCVVPFGQNIHPSKSANAQCLVAQRGGKSVLVASGQNDSVLHYDSVTLLNGQLLQVWEGKLTGIFHSAKGELIPPVYEKVEIIPGYAPCWAFVVQKYGMTAVVTDQNQMLLPYQNKPYVSAKLLNDTIMSYFPKPQYVLQDADMRYISKKGNPLKLKQIKSALPSEFIQVSINKYVLDVYKNGQLTSDTFSSSGKFVNGITPIKKDTLWGFLKDDCTWLIRPKFQAASPFDTSGLACVKIKGKYALIDLKGNVVFQSTYSNLSSIGGKRYQFSEGGFIGAITEKGKVLVPQDKYTKISVPHKDLLAAFKGDSALLFDVNGQKLSFNVPIFAVNGNGHDNQICLTTRDKKTKKALFGVANTQGQWMGQPVLIQGPVQTKYFWVINAQLDSCCTFGPVRVKEKATGQLVLGRDLKPLSNDQITVHKTLPDAPYLSYSINKKYGILTHDGQDTQPIFDEVHLLEHGWVTVRQGQQWAIFKQK